ncbi:MAG: DUF192 domain-containing protein [Coleofasciculaceae cyanobacterium]
MAREKQVRRIINPPIGLLGMLLNIYLMGCSASVQANLKDELSSTCQQLPSPSPSDMNLGQNLPISAQTAIGDEIICLELAQTTRQQQIGLMYRTSLAADRGMLFPYNPPRNVRFWMRNVRIPLDMVFLRDGEVMHVEANVPPCVSPECPTYGPELPIDQVLELRGGRVAELGVEVGDQINVIFLENN